MIAVAVLVEKGENVKPSFFMANDLNNIRYFAAIVEHGSLTAASESLGVAKSMLSQRLSSLEKELGVELIRRSSRRMLVTEIGRSYYAQCRVILGEVARASNITDGVRSLPRGKLRIACPLNFAQIALAPILNSFMLTYPDVTVALEMTNGTAAWKDEGYDFTLHIGSGARLPTLVSSSFKLDREMLVASPALLSRLGTPRTPADLASFPSAAGQYPPERNGRHVWHLSAADSMRQSVPHVPRLVTEDLWVLRESALAACALVALPPVLCRDAIDVGRLVRVLPNWHLREQKLHLLYPSRRGLTLAARTLIEFISRHVRTQLRSLQEGTLQLGTRAYGDRS
jgi:DNA-binding transcriptional LysR family regulator